MVTAQAPAKVNLALVVGPPGHDGYHRLATVFQALSLHDDVSGRLADDVSVDVSGPGAGQVPVGADNLAVRAARALGAYAGVSTGVRLDIVKRIPVAGGMAGGSADAAAALLACDAVWETGLGRAELHGLAARLGADVPFCLVGGTAVGTGRGDHLTPALASGTCHWVLALSRTGLATPAVYRELDRQRTGRRIPVPRVPDTLMAALRAGDMDRIGASLVNDLEPAACALRPRLVDTLAAGRAAGALGAVLCGSGPTCAFLVRDTEHGMDVSVTLAAARACDDVVRVTGPAPGARLL